MKKKILIATAIIILIIAITSAIQLSAFPLSSGFILASHSSEPQKLVAHRGFSSVYPENTIPAIEGAIEKGFYGCEFDIHTTKDGIWVLNHDSDIDKMTNGTGEIDQFTFEELQQYSIDNGNGIENYNDLKLPRLEDALELLSKSDTIPYIEIKGYDPVALENLLNIIRSFDLSNKAVIISFDMKALLGIRELSKDIQLMLLTNNLSSEDVDTCIKNGNIGVDINGGNILKMNDALKQAQENGLKTAAWTVDIPILADILNLFDIKIITTNRLLP